MSKAESVPIELYSRLCHEVCGDRTKPLCHGSSVQVAQIDHKKSDGFGGAITLAVTEFSLHHSMSIFKLWWRPPTPEEYSDLISPEILTIRGRLHNTGLWMYGRGSKYQSDVDVDFEKMKISLFHPVANEFAAMGRFLGKIFTITSELTKDVEREVVWQGDKTSMMRTSD